MATIEIRNIGPIRDAAFDLKKVNVFMGVQSSAERTIARQPDEVLIESC